MREGGIERERENEREGGGGAAEVARLLVDRTELREITAPCIGS